MAQNTTPKISPAPPKAAVISVADLLLHETSDQPWIIENLLKPGNQMILSAAPKTGKSFIAQQIAITLALKFAPGEVRYLFDPVKFEPASRRETKAPELPFEVSRHPGDGWKVLFVSLEMKEPETSGRLRKQLGGFGMAGDPKAEKRDTPEWTMPLDYCFGIEKPQSARDQSKTKQGLQIIREEEAKHEGKDSEYSLDAKSLAALFAKKEPDVVIYDTLIKLHSVNENDNVLMQALLQRLRDITQKPLPGGKGYEPIAHIIVHHTRKENVAYRGPLSPEMMRGAGSVHGVVDVVMLARLWDKAPSKDVLEVHVSSRSSSVDDFFLQKTPNLTYTWKTLSEDERVGKNIQKARCLAHGIIETLKAVDLNGALLNNPAVVLAGNVFKAQKKWSCKVPEGPAALGKALNQLIRERKVEYAVRPRPGVELDWNKHPVRLFMDQVDKPLAKAPPEKQRAGRRSKVATPRKPRHALRLRVAKRRRKK